MLRLHLNEPPGRVPPRQVQAALAQAATALNLYPDPKAPDLRWRYAAYAGTGATLVGDEALTPEQVIPTAGGDEAISLTVTALRDVVRQVVVMPPTFTEYARAARVVGLEVVEVPLTADWAIDVDSVVEAARRAPSLVFICSPNNPTGNALAVTEGLEALSGLEAWVAVDEAYWEFAGQTILSELGRYPRLVVLRTMSKAFCLAGLRIGFALAGVEFARRLEKTRMLFNIGSLGAALASAALAQPDYVAEVVEAVRAGRQQLIQGLERIPGFRPLPSLTNFVLCRTGRPGPDLARDLEKEGILVRAFPSTPVLSHHLRITVGSPEEVELCLEGLRAVEGPGRRGGQRRT